MKYTFLILLVFALVACENDEYPVRLEKDQIIRLLTRDQNKYWTPKSPIDCKQDDVIIFSIAEDDDTPGKYRWKKGVELCPEESEEDIVGTWEILTTGGPDRLFIYTSDTVRYEIIFLTSEHLHLRNIDSEWDLSAI